MDAFMNALIKMSLRGVVIIFIVLVVRLLLTKLQIGHKYFLGLWAMAFLYLIFPWKLSLPAGFWNNVNITEEMRVISERRPAGNESYGESGGTGNRVDPAGAAGSTMTGASAAAPKDTAGIVTEVLVELAGQKNPVGPVGQNIAGANRSRENSTAKSWAGRLTGLIWLIGLGGFFGHMLYSYFSLKRKLRLSVLFEDNIWWAENIDMPMVFGLLCPQIYLPVSMESGKPSDLSYVIAHEDACQKKRRAV